VSCCPPLSDSCHPPSALEPAAAKPQKRALPVSPMPARSRLIRPLLSPSKIHFIPVEILSEIFLLVVESRTEDPPVGATDQENLMLVCRRWETIMLSTPGIRSEVWICESTEKEDVQAAMQGRRWLLDLSISITTDSIWGKFNPDDFHACFMAAAQEASRWRTLEFVSLPPPDVCEPVQILQPLEHLESFSLGKHCNLGNVFEPLMSAITTTATHLTEMNLGTLDSILYVVQPACVHIFRSLRVLGIRLPKRVGGLWISSHTSRDWRTSQLKISSSQSIHLMLTFLLSRPLISWV
jgi:hypothetical protein